MDKVQDLGGCFSLGLCGKSLRVFLLGPYPTPHVRILDILWIRLWIV